MATVRILANDTRFNLFKFSFKTFLELNENKAFIHFRTILPSLRPKIKLRCTRKMVSDGRGRLFRRKDGKYLIYLPKDLAEDSMFPFKGADSIFVKVSFRIGKSSELLVEKWREPVVPTEKD